jgi:tetratricopeptide (TPR) repeat protein
MQTGGIAWRRLAALAASCLCACSGAKPRPLFVTPWRELTTENFVVQTDLDAPRAAEVAGQLELLRNRLVRALGITPKKQPRLQVVTFASFDELEVYRPGETPKAGVFVRDGGGGQRILLDGELQSSLRRVIAHEVIHSLYASVMPRQPRWFAEGVATLYTEVVVDGRPPRELAAFLNMRPLPTRQIFDWSSEDAELDPRRYGTSFLLVEMLVEQERAGFLELERRLKLEESPAAAWNATFPKWNQQNRAALDELDTRLTAWWQVRQPRLAQRETGKAPPFTERLMTSSEVHTLRLELPRNWKGDELSREIALALADEPDNVAALMAQGKSDPKSAPELSRRAVAAHPDDAKAWQFLATSLAGKEHAAEREAALRKAIGLAPDRIQGPVLLSAELLDQKRIHEALWQANAAVALGPWSPLAAMTQAFALASADRCEAALEAGHRALEIAGDDPNHAARRLLQKELQRIEIKCSWLLANPLDALARQASEAWRRGDADQAVALRREAVTIEPRNSNAWTSLGNDLLALDRYGEAEAAMQRAIDIDAEDPQAWDGLGRVRAARGQVTLAEAAFRRQLEIALSHRMALLDLGRLLLRNGRPAEARTPLARLLELDPQQLVATALMAEAQIRSGEKDSGVARLKQKAQENPGDITFNGLAYALALADTQLELAEDWALRSISGAAKRVRDAANADDAAVATRALIGHWDTLGWVRFRRGDLVSAERYVRAAERLVPAAAVSDHLGQILERLGRRDEAARAYARALASARPEFAIHQRLIAVKGNATEDELINKARAELVAMRSFALPAAAGTGGPWPDVLLTFNLDGSVAEVRASGTAALPAGAAALQGLKLEMALPDAGSLPVVRARYVCTSAGCSADFGGARPGSSG